MKRKYLVLTLFALPFIGENGGSFLFAQRTPTASMMMLPGVSDALPVPFAVSADINNATVPASPILWGMDTAWDSADNVTRGTNFIGKDVMTIGRVSFQPSDLVDANGNLSAAQQAALQSRLNNISISGVRDVILNCDHEALNSANYYGKPQEWYNVIKASIKYIRAKGMRVITVSPFNEPDYTEWGEGTMSHFRSICKLISEDPELADVRISAGNTLNCDKALSWYNFMKPYVTEGNTHQLAGSFDTYASFWQKVRSDGNYATADELHNVGEAFIGAHYGMQSGVWWGWDGAARGEYARASYYGKEIGYAENRNAWTAATVYKRNNGRIDGFVGSSERQAATSSFEFVSTERPVYFDGYGPVNAYTMTIPGGTGYQTGQTNAERLIQITSGADVPLDNIIGGTFVIMNVNSSMCLGYYNGANINGTIVTQMAYSSSSSATHQRWIVDPVNSRVGGDYSYFYLRNVRNNAGVMDVKDWSTSEGGSIIAYEGGLGANEQWFAEYAGEGNWYIRSRHSGLYLEIKNASKIINGQLQQAAFTGEPQQKWRFIPTNARLEQTAPLAPTGLKASALSGGILLQWEANSESDLAGYVVLRALAGADVNDNDAWDVIGRMVQGTSFIDNSAEADVQYVYRLKAVDRSRNQSSASDAVTCLYAYADAPLTSIASYTFDETLEDATHNCNDLVPSAAVAYNASDKKDGTTALTLDGNSYLAMPSSVVNHKQLTIAMWAKVGESSASWQRIFDFGNDTEHYFFLTPDNGSEMRVVLKDGGAEQILSASKPSAGWHHFAVTLADDAVTLFVDGEAVATNSSISIRPADFKPVRCYVGRSQYAADPLWKGSLDDMKVFNKALNATEVQKVMNGESPTAIDEVKGDNQPSSDVIYNLSGQKVNSSMSASGIYIKANKKVAK